MNSNLHELIFILDQSTEIKDRLEEAMNGFKGLVSAQKKLPVKANLTTDIFGSEYLTVFDNVPLELAETMPAKSTPLRSWRKL